MGIVAVDAGVEPFDVGELGIVGLAFVLVSAHSQTAELGGPCGEVVDVPETKLLTDRVFVSDTLLGDVLVDTDGGLASLVALHATCLRT